MLAPWVPLVRVGHHRLATMVLARTRGFAVAQVGASGPALTVVSVHLSLKPAERASHMAQILARFDGSAGELVLAGDLNEGPDGEAHRMVLGVMNPAGPDAATYPSRAPRHRLDVMFATSGVHVQPHVDVDLDEADLCTASDHRPIWADIDLDLGWPGPDAPQTRAPSSPS